jgi:hypothetical protein
VVNGCGMGLAAHVIDSQKLAICEALGAGVSARDIAAKFGRHESTIHRIKKELREASPKLTGSDIKQELVQRGYGILKTALTPTTNVEQAIKAAPIAVQTLKGLGEFMGDQQAAVSITFEPGSLDWMQAKQVGASSTPAALQAGEHVADIIEADMPPATDK